MKSLLAAFALMLGLASAAPAEEPAIIDMIEGEADAPLQIIEYASLTCPHCASFHADQYKQLRTDYIETGKASFTFREIYFDRPGLWASMMARCGGEMRFAGLIEMLMEEQSKWIGDGQGAGIVERLRLIGKRAGLSDEALDACMQDAEKAQALVTWSQANAKAHEITATPSLVINGETYSNMSYADLAALLDEKLAAAE